jgi:hypothetical protein
MPSRIVDPGQGTAGVYSKRIRLASGSEKRNPTMSPSLGDGFTHETDARAFKAQMQAAMGKDDCICLTRERPPGAIKRRK